MNCDTTRMALSALLDGELPAGQIAEVEDHLEHCPACRAWQEAAHDLTRRARVARVEPPARPSADAREQIHAAAGRASGAREIRVLRLLLVAVALGQFAITIPLLIFGRLDVVRDLGAMDMALAVGFVIVGWRPGRARAIAPVIGTAAGLLVLTALLGVIRDGDNAFSEAPHAIAFAGWLLVWRLGRVTPPTVESPPVPWWNSARAAATRVARRPDASLREPPRPPGHARQGLAARSKALPVGSEGQGEERRAAA